MNLFNISSTNVPYTPNNNILLSSIPMGNIFFDASFFNEKLSTYNFLSKQNENKMLALWDLEECSFEFVKFNFQPILPQSMKIENCFCGIWRVKSKINYLPIEFTCFVDPKEKLLEAYPETGEALIAFTAESREWKLSIGTEDEERLQLRARHKNWLPKRMENEITYNNIISEKNGIKIKLPSLLKDEVAQIHFIIAYNPKNANESATWFAVEQNLLKMFPSL